MKKMFLALLVLTTAVPAMARDFSGQEILPKGTWEWDNTIPDEGSLSIRVNLATQMAYVYRGDAVIAETSISTGRDGYETPTGTFPIWGKEANHHSKHYDADMPYTQWLTHDGVALHAGGDPGRPSSHGCIHLPLAFAKTLYGLTTIGVVVEVVNEAPNLGIGF